MSKRQRSIAVAAALTISVFLFLFVFDKDESFVFGVSLNALMYESDDVPPQEEKEAEVFFSHEEHFYEEDIELSFHMVGDAAVAFYYTIIPAGLWRLRQDAQKTARV